MVKGTKDTVIGGSTKFANKVVKENLMSSKTMSKAKDAAMGAAGNKMNGNFFKRFFKKSSAAPYDKIKEEFKKKAVLTLALK